MAPRSFVQPPTSSSTPTGSNLFATYDWLHYSVSSSNTSVLKVYKPDRQANEDFGTLKAGKLGSADIAVKLFNNLNDKRRVSVRRNRFIDNNFPDLEDLEEDDYSVFCYSAEILASNKVEVVYYIYNNGPLKLAKLTNVEAGFMVDDDDLCWAYPKSLTLNLKPYSIMAIKLTFSGRGAVDSDIAIDTDLTQYAGEDEEEGTYGYLNGDQPLRRLRGRLRRRGLAACKPDKAADSLADVIYRPKRGKMEGLCAECALSPSK